MQRVKVGMTGLAIVLLLIGLASLVFSAASRNSGTGARTYPNNETIANVATANATESPDEPMTELGVSPGTQADQGTPKRPVSNR